MERSVEVDKYFANAPDKFSPLLAEIRDNIFEILVDEPEMSEVFSYQIAVYKYGRKPLFSLAYFKGHCSLITQDKNIGEKLSKELEGYKISGTSIHFTDENPILFGLLKKIIQTRLASRKAELGGK